MLESKKAQLFSLDLMLALVPLTIALGMSANAMSGVMNQMQEYSEWYSAKDRVDDAVDVLIKTPGVPAQWNDTNPPIVVGLAEYTESEGTRSMFIDEDKFGALNSTYPDAIPSLFGGNISYYNLTVIGLAENMTNFTSSVTGGTRADASSIYVSDRMAFYKFTTIVGNPIMNVSRWQVNDTYVCDPGSGPNPKPTFYSNFTVKENDTVNYDYWLVTYCDKCSLNPKYRVDSDPLADGENRTDCSGISSGLTVIKTTGGGSCECDSNDDYCIEDVGSSKVSKYRITDEIDEPTAPATELMNTVFIKIFGDPDEAANFYVVRVAKNTCDSDVSAMVAGYWPVKIKMEIGL